jgi:hypothetical protein
MFNDIKSHESYVTEKYYKWARCGVRAIQESDPSYIQCSYCGHRTHDLKIFHDRGRDFLVCKDHAQYGKGD